MLLLAVACGENGKVTPNDRGAGAGGGTHPGGGSNSSQSPAVGGASAATEGGDVSTGGGTLTGGNSAGGGAMSGGATGAGGFAATGGRNMGGETQAGGTGGGTTGLSQCSSGLGGAPPMIPETSWTVQFGSSSEDQGRHLAVDCQGDIYIIGHTEGVLGDNLTENLGEWDAYVRKLSGVDGRAIWTRQFGTATDDRAHGVAINSEGDVIVTGVYRGLSVGEASGWGDVFLAKLAGATGEELWLRQYTTIETEFAFDVTVDSQDEIVVVGYMGTTDWDGFTRKFSGEDGALLWETRFGTDVSDVAHASVVNDEDDIFVVGQTNGNLGGEGSAGSVDTFIRRIDGATGNEQWTVQFGSNQQDYGHGIALALDGDIVVGGSVGSDASIDGQPSEGSSDGFVRKVSAVDGGEIWTEQWGTSESEEVWNVAIDDAGNVFISGRTYGDLGGINLGYGDHYIQELDGTTGSEIGAELYGTTMNDAPARIAFDPADNLIMVGFTPGVFPATENAGSWDVYVIKVDR